MEIQGMGDNRKSRAQLIQEVEDLRRRISELEKSETERQLLERKPAQLTRIREELITSKTLREKLKIITDGLVDYFRADFARIWIIKPGDRCSECVHAQVKEGPHVCRSMEQCLHLMASSGRYTHLDGGIHSRVPYGCYKIGLVASGALPGFVTNAVTQDSRVHNLDWARTLGLVSFAGYRLLSAEGVPIGVMALFSQHVISSDDDDLLKGLANSTAQVIQTAKIEETLRESEERYRTAIEQSNDGIALVKGDRHIFVNQKMVEIFGYDRPEEIVGHPIDLMIHSEDQERVKDINRRRQKGEAVSQQYQFKGQRKNGEPLYIEVSASATTYLGEAVSLAYLRDITDRKRVEEALQESENKFKSFTEQALVGVYLIQDGIFKYVNPKFAQMFGYTVEEYLNGMPFKNLVYAEDLNKVEEQVGKRIAEEVKFTHYTFKGLKKNGQIFDVEIYGSAIIHRGKLAALGTILDITERRQAEEEKRKLEEQLQRAEKMEALGTLAGGVAHDLNNVLGIIVGYSELLLYDVEGSSPLRPGLVNILEGSQRAAAIVQDLLTLTRRGVAGRKVLNLNRLILDFVKSTEWEKLLSYHPAVQIKTDLEPDLLNISASSVHLEKSLFNLVSNASEAMPKGGHLTLKTTNQYLDQSIQGYDQIREGDYVVLSVSDAGEGISATDLKRIFEPFYTKKIMGRSGTGLGLAVVWGTVKDHNGYIDVQSEEGKGTLFTLYFPVTREEITAEDHTVPLSEYLGKGEALLIVDDVRGQRDLATTMLKKLNYHVTSASSGEGAVAYLKEHTVDLVVLDMIMDPGLDGLDTYKKILEIHPRQKAIIVSGFSETERVNIAQALGAGAYIKKPYVLEKLGLAVRKELDRVI
jgi:PAS domain S-box-containing protein